MRLTLRSFLFAATAQAAPPPAAPADTLASHKDSRKGDVMAAEGEAPAPPAEVRIDVRKLM